MRYISLFSGIEACSVGWHHMGWTPVAFADFDAFASAVLEYHYPTVSNLGDVTKVNWHEYRGKAEIVVGGSPCQSFSIAGKKLGMDDPRGNLALHYLRVVGAVQPKWFIYENVPGLLSSNEGEDFATFLREVAKLGYGFAYRVLDAQHFGVPQRRRRVFVVGCADGDWRSAAAILFDEKSLCGDSYESKKKKRKTSLFSEGSVREESGDLEKGIDKKIIHAEKIAPSMSASGPPYSRTGQQVSETQAIVVQGEEHIVRRLTPTECERLQGFPDNYTQVPWKGKPRENCPDAPRYMALGNSMAVPVMRWIGERIDMLDSADISNREAVKTSKQMTLW